MGGPPTRGWCYWGGTLKPRLQFQFFNRLQLPGWRAPAKQQPVNCAAILIDIHEEMRNVIAILITFLPLFLSSQEKKFYQLELKKSPYYKEFNHFLADSLWRINQTIAYDDPNYIDEESWLRLVIEIEDTAAFLRAKHLNLTTDCQTAKYNFAFWSIWDYDRDSTAISGQLELISMTEKGIALRLDIVVKNLRTSINLFIQEKDCFTKQRRFESFTIIKKNC